MLRRARPAPSPGGAPRTDGPGAGEQSPRAAHRSRDRRPWADVATVFGTRGEAAHCWCQRFTLRGYTWYDLADEAKAELLREQVSRAPGPGLLVYVDDEPVGWCSVGPRPAYPRLPWQRTALEERGEDPADGEVWLVTCFVVRVGHRRQGLVLELCRAAVEHARRHGARAVEGYPLLTTPGVDVIWGELHVGSRSAFAEAGFTQVAHPTPRRVVMRLEL